MYMHVLLFAHREVAGDNNPLLVELTATIVSWFGPRNQVNPAFAASWAYVVTWDQVPAYPGGGSVRLWKIPHMYYRAQVHPCKMF